MFNELSNDELNTIQCLVNQLKEFGIEIGEDDEIELEDELTKRNMNN